MDGFPLPGAGRAVVAVPAPGAGPGWWAGAPGVALAEDGTFVIGYRVRNGHDGNDQVVVAVSEDGERLQSAAVLDESHFGAMAVERPSLVRRADGGWRLYVCCATPESKHWWIGALDADDLAGLATADVRRVFPGDDAQRRQGPRRSARRRNVARVDLLPPARSPGDEDRMNTAYATSDDGLDWQWHGTVLEGRPGKWDARGARLTTVLPDGRAAYDGRRTAEENWFERTGLARRTDRPGGLEHAGEEPVADVRYLEALPLPGGGYRIWYEARLPDESHELRTELVPA